MCHICEDKLDDILAPYDKAEEMALALRTMYGFDLNAKYPTCCHLLCPCGLAVVTIGIATVQVSFLKHDGRWHRCFVRSISKAN